ncbi:MAG: hypothetical protein Q3961_04040, partial [Bifidobacteriaceae bacterium]|nr:hypothetical protein [Bifidobacteriaceae bacterium]
MDNLLTTPNLSEDNTQANTKASLAFRTLVEFAGSFFICVVLYFYSSIGSLVFNYIITNTIIGVALVYGLAT